MLWDQLVKCHGVRNWLLQASFIFSSCHPMPDDGCCAFSPLGDAITQSYTTVQWVSLWKPFDVLRWYTPLKTVVVWMSTFGHKCYRCPSTNFPMWVQYAHNTPCHVDILYLWQCFNIHKALALISPTSSVRHSHTWQWTRGRSKTWTLDTGALRTGSTYFELKFLLYHTVSQDRTC